MEETENSESEVQDDVVVRAECLTKLYPRGKRTVRAVDDVSLEVARGEFVFLSGPSASGKTTLLSLIGGLTSPTAGEVEVCGVRWSGEKDAAASAFRASKIGFAFQFSCLLPTLTVLDNVRLPGVFAGRPDAESRQNAARLLEAVGLLPEARSYPDALSGGEQRRVCLARALVNDPVLLLADEPTGDLDRDTEHEIMEILEASNRNGLSILMVSHDTTLAQHAHRQLHMSEGKLLAR